MLTFASEIYEPEVIMTKTQRNVNGGQSQAGDIIEYTIVLENVERDNAVEAVVTDPIPPNTTYVPGSLEVVYGPNMSPITDGSGDDQGEFIAGNGPRGEVVLRVGSGADATNGGTLAQNVPTAVRFRVKIDAGVIDGTTIFNQALLGYVKATLGGPVNIVTSGASTASSDAAPISSSRRARASIQSCRRDVYLYAQCAQRWPRSGCRRDGQRSASDGRRVRLGQRRQRSRVDP